MDSIFRRSEYPVLNHVGGTTIHEKIYSKDRDSGQNILLRMYLVNIRDFGHSNEQIPFMLTDGTSLEHSPQSVLLHQDSEKSQNYQNGFIMQSKSLSIITFILKEVKNWK
ncbi:hypothetical protein ACS0TY_010466 [Phlomoides rotata]